MLKVFALLALYSPPSDTADVFRGLVVPFLLVLSGGSSGPPPFRAEIPNGPTGWGFWPGKGSCADGFWVSVCVPAKIFMFLTFNLCFCCSSLKCSMTK